VSEKLLSQGGHIFCRLDVLMFMNKTKLAAMGAGILAMGFVGGSLAHAQIDKLFKGAAVIAIVDKNGRDIDKFVNQVTGNKNDDPAYITKTVPILTVGKGAFAGAAQVQGPVQLVDKVKAVAQLEGQTRLGVQIRVRGLVPIDNRSVDDPGKLSRVLGVGITGTVEIKL
jgi:hypothetical protein